MRKRQVSRNLAHWNLSDRYLGELADSWINQYQLDPNWLYASSPEKNKQFNEFFTDWWWEMVKEILSADDNLHTKLMRPFKRAFAWRDFWFIPPVACGVPTQIIIQVQSSVNHWMVAKQQPTYWSAYE